MNRIQVHLTDEQISKLEEAQVSSGLSRAEIIRRFIDIGLARFDRSKNERATKR